MFIFVVQLHAQGPKNLSGTMPAVCNDPARDSASVHISVRDITSISQNIYHLRKLKLCLFNNNF